MGLQKLKKWKGETTMGIQVGEKLRVNTQDGEVVTVLYVSGDKCLLLRESGNLIKANGFFIEGNLIFWNAGGYADNDMFEKIMELM